MKYSRGLRRLVEEVVTAQNEAGSGGVDKRTVFLTGFSQGGTTLLLSLFDGHSKCAVYPDEPGFYKLWRRSKRYQDPIQLFADCLVGLPNAIHLAPEYAAAKWKRIKDNHQPVVSQGDAREIIADVRDRFDELIAEKKLRGLEENLSPEKHRAFFKDYFDCFLGSRESDVPSGLGDLYARCFRSLAGALTVVTGTESRPAFQVFKQPFTTIASMSNLDGFLDLFPHPVIVFIVRNPHARLYSMIRYREDRGSKPTRLRLSPLRFLTMAVKNARDYRDFLRWHQQVSKREDIVFMSYESLVTDPRTEMTQVLSKLRLDAEEISFTPTKLGVGSRITTNRTSSADAVSAENVAIWQSGLSRLEKLISRWLVKLYTRRAGNSDRPAQWGF